MIELVKIGDKQLPVHPGLKSRAWMSPHAYRCLPMVIANAFGWDVMLPADIVVEWDGGEGRKDVVICEGPARAEFGLGTLTLSLDWVWHTPPGVQLMCMPVPNEEHQDFQTLTSIIETDHFDYPWFCTLRLREPGRWLIEKGTRICRVIPVRLSDVSSICVRPESPSELEFRDSMAAERDKNSDKPWIRWYHERVHFPSFRSPEILERETTDLKEIARRGVLVVENFLQPRACEEIVRLMEEMNPTKTDDEWNERAYYVPWPEELRETIKYGIIAELVKYAGLKNEPKIYNLSCVEWAEGHSMDPHRDDADGRYPERQWAAVIYLNEDYEGGESYWPGLNFEMQPSRGDLFLFRGDRLDHGVREVTKGMRRTCICWLEEQ